MQKFKWLLPLALFVPLLMAPTGGYPTNPTFQSVQVNGADNLSLVNYNDTGSLVAGIYSGWSNGGTLVGALGTGGVVGAGCSLGDFCVSAQKAGNSLRLGVAGGIAQLSMASTGAVTLLASSSGNDLTVNGSANSDTLFVHGNATSGQSLGLLVEAGTTSADIAARILNQAATLAYFEVLGDGGVEVGNAGVSDVGIGGISASNGYFINNVPAMVSFDANLVVSPSFINCHHCQGTPTVVRNSIGNYTIQPQSVGAYDWACTIRNNAAAPGTVAINSTTTGGFTLLGWSTAGALADPGTVECIGIA